MKREEARLKFRAKQYYTDDGDLVIPRPYAYDIIDEIFDEYEAEVEAMQERIKELETPKTCDGCNAYDAKSGYCNDDVRIKDTRGVPETFYCKWHEPKDNQ